MDRGHTRKHHLIFAQYMKTCSRLKLGKIFARNPKISIVFPKENRSRPVFVSSNNTVMKLNVSRQKKQFVSLVKDKSMVLLNVETEKKKLHSTYINWSTTESWRMTHSKQRKKPLIKNIHFCEYSQITKNLILRLMRND